MAIQKRTPNEPPQPDLAREQGEQRYRALAAEIESSHATGAIVAINTVTGEYVVAPSYGEALAAFEAAFGDAPGWMRPIGDEAASG